MNDKIRKRNLKRKIAFLLALSMVCSFPYSISAEAALSNTGETQDNNEEVLSGNNNDIVENNAESEDENEPSTLSNDNENVQFIDTGMIEVVIQNLFDFANDVECTATLIYPDGSTSDIQDFLISKELEESKISFNNLADGIYVLRVKAKGFATYEQAIDVQNQMMYTVKLTTGFCNGYDYESDSKQPGVLLIGDVNNDGIVNDGVTDEIDDTDKEILIDAIYGETVSEDYVTDLNNDGNTDLLDLMFFSKGYKEEQGKNIKASIESSISPLAMSIHVAEGTSVEGDLSELLNNDDTAEPVKLTPSDEGEISEDNPVSLDIDMTQGGSPVEIEEITFQTGNDIDSLVDEGNVVIEYIDENGKEQQIPVYFKREVAGLSESDIIATLDENGNIDINLGNQVAVKKVTLSITKMARGSNNLVEISKVEFLNGMENRIPEPEMDKPENLTAKAGSEKFSLSWSPCMNVTGYEVQIKNGNKIVQTLETSLNSMTVSGDDIKNYVTYTVSVQSLNGTWKSGYCDSVDVTPVATKRPDKPDNVKASGLYRGIKVSWANMDDTQSYNVFYKKADSDEKFTEISDITSNSYTIEGLEDITEYEVYVIGINELGSSPESLHCSAKTTDLNLADMPKYNLINRDEDGNPGSTHIVDVKRYGGEMIDSPLDTEDGTAWGAVDGSKDSYYSKNTWDDGGFNGIGNNGLTYTFDKEYTMDTIGILTTQSIDYTNIRCWDDDGNLVYVLNDGYSNISKKQTDSEGRPYYILKFPKAVTASKVQISLARYLASPVTVAETYFYNYDYLMDEIMDLYVDDLHTVLKDNVTQKTINTLREKVNTPDEYGEENINKEALLRELETAEKILNAESLSSAVEVHNGITTKDTGRGFSGLNAWQPLGVSIGTGEEVTIYVGSNQKKTGDGTDLRLIVTQYHSESGNVVLEGANLKVGANTFKLTKSAIAGVESGGALYIQYQGADTSNERYSVRVTGGSEVPFLDLYKVTDEDERLARTVEYINKLDKYVPKIEALHNKVHKGSGNKYIDYDYDKTNCILEASDIMLDTMMYSLPAQQILAGAGKGTVEERAKTVLKSMEATEDMMYLFYQHKGLNADAPDELNQIPKGHQNIRYQRMFSGAFMYASGNHIGIEWGSVPAMMQGVPIESTEDGKYVSGSYFGWGISHEIGHCINQGDYAVAEITNNYFSQLGQSQDKNSGMRFQYQNIYDKVTSGTKGNCSNIATQLGMYWQLHIAYDKGLNYKTYSDYEEQLENLFYARVDTYSRNPKVAPAPKEIALTLDGDSDQKLMRLACAAAEKNILEFFERWGKTPDSETIAYAEQFEKETRAIFYANDDSRIYALNGKGSVLGTESSVSVIKDVSVNIGKSSNKVELAFTSADIPEADILGYEIIRCTISGGKVEEVPVGFTTGTEFTDTVTTLNNRTVFYKITLIDNYLNRSEVFNTKTVKIEHDGSMDKTNWSINTTGLTAESVIHDATDEMPCEQTEDNPAKLALDNDLNTIYTPQIDGDTAEIVIDFNQTLTVSGLKYTAGDGESIGDYEVYVMENNEWVPVSDGTFKGSKTVYFANSDDKYISTYSATAVKLVLLNQDKKTVSIAELDVLGVTGDNVDFRRTEEEATAVIGTLSEDYKYGENEDEVIPKDSLIFTGSYKGNPAYNVVILYDVNGNIVGGVDAEENILSQQIILADVPDNSNIANVSDGTWIYWIEPDQMENMKMPEMVRVELYRVNNALTNEGQRLVSDSLLETVPEKLPTITLSGNEK
ncbi:MAG: fibronectin type III domain-containing protein [Ruminococcus sp.]|nr:fibronectin type III domain-containing protein [Ruminococcus sp.]